MKISCPKCTSHPPLKATQLRDKLIAYCCEQCAGNYLPAKNYIPQIASDRASVVGDTTSDETQLIDDTIEALLCPECQHIMIKYLVGQGIAFKIDFCRHCNGVWLDAKEWEFLVSKNLHRDLNNVFTETWQTRVRNERTQAHLRKLFRNKLGDVDYERVTDFKKWLLSSNHKAEIVSFLLDRS